MYFTKHAKILRFSILLIFSGFFVCSFGVSPLKSFAQTAKNTLQDYGISQQEAQNLTAQQIQTILGSKTPAQTQADQISQIKSEINQLQQSNSEQDKVKLDRLLSSLNSLEGKSPIPEGATSCLNYYTPNSINVGLVSQNFSINPGDVMHLSGFVSNKNNYPIVNGSLYIKILRTLAYIKNSSVFDVADQFVAVDNISIPANGQTPVSFSWQSPKSLLPGNYEVASFFVVGKKFNVLGAENHSDSSSSSFNFQVNPQSDNTQGVLFDKSGIKINGQHFAFQNSYPVLAATVPAVVSASIINTTSQDQKANVLWNLYKFNDIDPSNFIRTLSETVEIKSKSSADASITIPEADETGYLLVGEVNYKDSKSFIDVFFGRPLASGPVLDFASVTGFPLKWNGKVSMFSCLNNNGQDPFTQNSKLEITLTDTKGKVINDYVYTGQISRAVMALAKTFSSGWNYDHFFLTTKLWQEDKLVDQSTLEYDCSKINPKLCGYNYNVLFLVLAFIVLLVIIAGVIIYRRKNK